MRFGSHFRSYGFALWSPQSFLYSRTRAASVGSHFRRASPSPIGLAFQLKSAAVSAALAAGPAHKACFDIGQPKIIGPAVGADGDRVT
jgi:hypothetical protein